MVDDGQLGLIQSLLAAPSLGKCPTLEEKLAWVLLFRSHTKLIRFVLKRRGVHESDVDDLEQQVWIALLKRLGKFEKVFAAGDMSEYIRKSAGREAARHLRRWSKRTDTLLTADVKSALLDPARGPLSEYECKERRDRARAILAAARSSLSDDDHRMLVMRCIEVRSIREIAGKPPQCASKLGLTNPIRTRKTQNLRFRDFASVAVG
jgi:RNA polymerase sigma factor (sigma-70 family)